VPKAFWSGIGSGNRRGKNRRKGIAYPLEIKPEENKQGLNAR
jgi:hypothetical protein